MTVYYGSTEPRTYNVPNSAGNLWTVFTIDGSSKVVTTVNNMSAAAGTTAGSDSIESVSYTHLTLPTICSV